MTLMVDNLTSQKNFSMKQLGLIFTIAILAGCFGSEPQKTGKEGNAMPDFSILLTDSITWFHTRDIPTGKPIVLFYFSPYCPYCKAQAKEIVEDMDRLKDIQFYFISGYPLPTVKEFYGQYKLDKYSNITIGIDSANLISDYFEIPGIPYLAIYNRNKKLNKTFLGKIYSSQLKKTCE
jgi:thiol-disulfide isomerase/thioredoxin